MSLVTPAAAAAAKLSSNADVTLAMLRSQASSSYAIMATAGMTQDILDAFAPGQAAVAVNIYIALYNALNSLGAASGLVAPDLDLFVINEDGSVTYTPPAP